MQLHGYLSIFFLPLACVYAFSGSAYLWLDPKESLQMTIEIQNLVSIVPVTEEKIKAVILQELPKNGIFSSPRGKLKQQGNRFSWGDQRHLRVKYYVSAQNPQTAILKISTPTLYGRLIGFHKGKGSGLIKGLGTGFALLLIVSYLSGLFLALKTTWLKKFTILSFIIGLILTLISIFPFF